MWGVGSESIHSLSHVDGNLRPGLFFQLTERAVKTEMKKMNDVEEYRDLKAKDSHFLYPVSWPFGVSMITVLVGLIMMVASVVPPINRIDQIAALMVVSCGFCGALLATLIATIIGVKCSQCLNKMRHESTNEYVHIHCDQCKIRCTSLRPGSD
jgi:uncharacterized membrane protein (DUF485 family)